ncbi:MAG TPA: hypothetical protein VFQ85_12950 [Mycobacteriales bacterium]|nr:hypothetical protein [Mycobacteriales bacterium]
MAAAAALAVTAPPIAAAGHAATASALARAAAPAAASAAHRLPVAFEENRGQVADRAVRFVARTRGGVALLTADGFAVAPVPTPVVPRLADSLGRRQLRSFSAAASATRRVSVRPVRVRFAGASTRVLEGTGRLPGVVNYLHGNDPAGWRTGVRTFAAVVYRDLYPGVELRYDAGAGGGLKGTYTVAPGADPAVIRWRYPDSTRIRITDGGDLAVDVAGQQVVERAPVAWQTMTGLRRPVPVRYRLEPNGALGFTVGGFDRHRPLVIDPELVYSRFVGDGATSWLGTAPAVAADSAGNTYLAGLALGLADVDDVAAAVPSSVWPLDQDVAVVKLDAAGRLVFLTIIGGNTSYDIATSIALDRAGLIHVVGATTSRNFPVVRAAQPRLRDRSNPMDGFVFALDPGGATLHYSTFLGAASGWDELRAIAVAPDGTTYAAGYTDGADFPLRHPVDAVYGGFGESVLTVFTPPVRSYRAPSSAVTAPTTRGRWRWVATAVSTSPAAPTPATCRPVRCGATPPRPASCRAPPSSACRTWRTSRR